MDFLILFPHDELSCSLPLWVQPWDPLFRATKRQA